MIETILHIIGTFNFWITIAIIEFFIIVILLSKKRKFGFEKPYISEIEKSKTKNIDMSDLMFSMFKSKELYDKLRKNIHADKFAPDLELMKIADEIAKEINANKANYKKLEELKAIAEEKLSIKI